MKIVGVGVGMMEEMEEMAGSKWEVKEWRLVIGNVWAS